MPTRYHMLEIFQKILILAQLKDRHMLFSFYNLIKRIIFDSFKFDK
jgi:hypothetical protein